MGFKLNEFGYIYIHVIYYMYQLELEIYKNKRINTYTHPYVSHLRGLLPSVLIVIIILVLHSFFLFCFVLFCFSGFELKSLER